MALSLPSTPLAIDAVSQAAMANPILASLGGSAATATAPVLARTGMANTNLSPGTSVRSPFGHFLYGVKQRPEVVGAIGNGAQSGVQRLLAQQAANAGAVPGQLALPAVASGSGAGAAGAAMPMGAGAAADVASAVGATMPLGAGSAAGAGGAAAGGGAASRVAGAAGGFADDVAGAAGGYADDIFRGATGGATGGGAAGNPGLWSRARAIFGGAGGASGAGGGGGGAASQIAGAAGGGGGAAGAGRLAGWAMSPAGAAILAPMAGQAGKMIFDKAIGGQKDGVVDDVIGNAIAGAGIGGAFRNPWTVLGGAVAGGLYGFFRGDDTSDETDYRNAIESETEKFNDTLGQLAISPDLRSIAQQQFALGLNQATTEGQVKEVRAAVEQLVAEALPQDLANQTAASKRDATIMAMQSWLPRMLEPEVNRANLAALEQQAILNEYAGQIGGAQGNAARNLAASLPANQANMNMNLMMQMMTLPQMYGYMADPVTAAATPEEVLAAQSMNPGTLDFASMMAGTGAGM